MDDEARRRGRSRWLRTAGAIGVWTVVGLFFSGQIYLDYFYAGSPIRWIHALYLSLAEWWIWALLSPLIFALVRRFPFERGRWGRALAVQLPASFAVTLVKLTAETPLAGLWPVARLNTPNMNKFNVSLLTAWLIFGIGHALASYRASQERQRRALELESHLARARFQILQNQLQPHFLFNTLNAVTTLMHRDVDSAETMLIRLSDLLRLALDGHERQELPLNEELEFTRLYLEIQQVRFRDRLLVEYEIGVDTLDACVPAMLLQPLVENAVEHGVARRAAQSRVAVTAAKQDDRMVITVEDDGPGTDGGGASSIREGVGLANTRARLEQLHGPEGRMQLEDLPAGGFRVTVTLPFRTVPTVEHDGAA